jgi:hypothetical protein
MALWKTVSFGDTCPLKSARSWVLSTLRQTGRPAVDRKVLFNSAEPKDDMLPAKAENPREELASCMVEG